MSDLLKEGVVFLPDNISGPSHVLRTVDALPLAPINMATFNVAGYAIANVAYVNGHVRIINTTNREDIPKGTQWAEVLIGTRGGDPVYILIGEYTTAIPRVAFLNEDPAAYENLAPYKKLFVTLVFTPIEIEFNDFVDVELNAIGQWIAEQVPPANRTIYTEAPLQLAPILLLSKTSACLKFAQSSMLMSSATTMCIQGLNEDTFLSIVIGICCSMPGDICDVARLHNTIVG